MVTNDVWLLTVQGMVTETMHVHTLHFRENAGESSGVDLITAYTAAPLTAYRGMFSQYTFPVQLIRAQKVCGSVPLPSANELAYATAAQGGTRNTTSQDPMPAYVAALVNERGSLAGRRYRGRFFIGGLHEIDCIGNTLQPTYLAMVQAYINALKAAFVTPAIPPWRLFAFSNLLADGDPFHTRRNPNPPPERIADPVAAVSCELAGSDVADLIVSTRPTTMRSRKLGHGL